VLLFLSAVKLVCEVALLALAGQGLLHVLAGSARERNIFYQLLRVLTRPFTAAMRRVTPRRVADAQVPIAAFCVLVLVWAVVTFEKIRYCVQNQMQGCQ
jgi:hypothetical protein